MLRLLPVLGIVLVLVGLGVFGGLPDGWWDPKGFIVNLASGLTAACFGVPVAFFILQRLLGVREDAEHKMRLQQTIRTSLRDLKSAVVTVVDGDRFSIERCVEHIEILDLGLSQMNSIEASGDLLDDAVVSEVPSHVRHVQGMLDAIRDELTELRLSDFTTRDDWAMVQVRWTFVATSALPQARLAGLEPMPEDLQYRLNRSISAIGPIATGRELSILPRLTHLPPGPVREAESNYNVSVRGNRDRVSMRTALRISSAVSNMEESLKDYLSLLDDLDAALAHTEEG
ncbi:hypothetical protein [Actinomycetospora sp. TBRC 11914]|uniref:hypothetical protein n=1 Tax=Actinomycetospora sp. TBRC 11914 TaxID=2729387 RepID=UPI00145D4A0C|nr:hypothetical protein [Actinomycetospora sp. TBRC 11914]NMO93207.1 hypothetical protein [Actinomycetospora sp. TBRC 11914]